MRIGLLLVGASILAGCAPSPMPMERTPEARARLDQLLAGRVAGPPQNCISRLGSNDMTIIDDDTVVFKSGGTYYRNDFRGQGCSGLSRPWYSLVSRSFSGSQLCSGEIANVTDLRTGTLIGTCSFGEFVPYRRP